MTKQPETFAARLRTLRTKAGLSVPDLARAAGVPTSTVHRLETGERSPTLDTAKKLAAALSVSLAAFE